MAINIGDRIRIIPNTYMYLSKAGYLSQDTWCTPNLGEDTCAMLGGEYEVLGCDQPRNRPLYRVLPDAKHARGFVAQEESVLAENVQLCPFSVGDSVYFNCRWSEQDYYQQQDVLYLYYGFDEPEASHKITSVINGYYVLLDYELNEPNGTPFRWEHLSKAE